MDCNTIFEPARTVAIGVAENHNRTYIRDLFANPENRVAIQDGSIFSDELGTPLVGITLKIVVWPKDGDRLTTGSQR